VSEDRHYQEPQVLVFANQPSHSTQENVQVNVQPAHERCFVPPCDPLTHPLVCHPLCPPCQRTTFRGPRFEQTLNTIRSGFGRSTRKEYRLVSQRSPERNYRVRNRRRSGCKKMCGWSKRSGQLGRESWRWRRLCCKYYYFGC